jgi:hypothetical protein
VVGNKDIDMGCTFLGEEDLEIANGKADLFP